MSPAGYMLKIIAPRPDWLKADVDDIYSLSPCVSRNLEHYESRRRHNGFWLFNEKILQKQRILSRYSLRQRMSA